MAVDRDRGVAQLFQDAVAEGGCARAAAREGEHHEGVVVELGQPGTEFVAVLHADRFDRAIPDPFGASGQEDGNERQSGQLDAGFDRAAPRMASTVAAASAHRWLRPRPGRRARRQHSRVFPQQPSSDAGSTRRHGVDTGADDDDVEIAGSAFPVAHSVARAGRK